MTRRDYAERNAGSSHAAVVEIIQIAQRGVSQSATCSLSAAWVAGTSPDELTENPVSQALMQQAFQRPDSLLFADKLGVGRSESKHHDNLATILPDCNIR
jgi:hypothetical protein